MAVSRAKSAKSFPTRERGLKLSMIQDIEENTDVVPHAGTWIEIDGRDAYDDYMTSFPTRERGLKSCTGSTLIHNSVVVPHAGTWIEIRTI